VERPLLSYRDEYAGAVCACGHLGKPGAPDRMRLMSTAAAATLPEAGAQCAPAC